MLPSKLTLEKPLKQEGNTDLKSRQRNCQKHSRCLKALTSCRISRKDKTEGLCCVWRQGRAERAEGECEECSVLLLPLTKCLPSSNTREGQSLATPSPQGLTATSVHRTTTEWYKDPIGLAR